jgi:thioredoxin reductase
MNKAMKSVTDVAIIGAGPYGLSLAAHLAGLGVEHRIFGQPMQSWIDGTPAGMLLKSDGFASNLSDPANRFTLKQYCLDRSIGYADLGWPVPREIFIAYGLEFQRRLIPHLERKLVASIDRGTDAFHLRCDDGETVAARRVIIATGLAPFAYMPPQFENLPVDRRSHSVAVSGPRRFAGRNVVVVGGGASALDLAALLHETGASVTLAARASMLDIHYKMRLPRPWSDRLSAPLSGIGPSWRSRILCDFPHIFRLLPAAKRLDTVKNHLGPAAGWFMKERVENTFPILLGYRSMTAEATAAHLRLTFETPEGTRVLTPEHVIAATGFHIALERLQFLSDNMRGALATIGGAPILSSKFESSLPDLFFIGPAAANCFGPVMRFSFGAGFTAQRLSRHLQRTTRDRRPEYFPSAPSPEPERPKGRNFYGRPAS